MIITTPPGADFNSARPCKHGARPGNLDQHAPARAAVNLLAGAATRNP
jgi:hypothetical protein